MSVTREGKEHRIGGNFIVSEHMPGGMLRGSILAGRALTEYDWKPRSMTRVQLDVEFGRRTASVSERRLCLNGDSVGVSSACCRHTLARIVALRVPTLPPLRLALVGA